jgi:hypothetical protein
LLQICPCIFLDGLASRLFLHNISGPPSHKVLKLRPPE